MGTKKILDRFPVFFVLRCTPVTEQLFSIEFSITQTYRVYFRKVYLYKKTSIQEALHGQTINLTTEVGSSKTDVFFPQGTQTFPALFTCGSVLRSSAPDSGCGVS